MREDSWPILRDWPSSIWAHSYSSLERGSISVRRLRGREGNTHTHTHTHTHWHINGNYNLSLLCNCNVQLDGLNDDFTSKHIFMLPTYAPFLLPMPLAYHSAFAYSSPWTYPPMSRAMLSSVTLLWPMILLMLSLAAMKLAVQASIPSFHRKANWFF